MTDLALVTANRVNVVESIEQVTLPAFEAIVAGAPMRIDPTTGKFRNGNGSSAAEARGIYCAARTVAAGEAVTGIKKGVIDGYDLTALNFDAPVYLSDTDATLADAAGTVSTVIGRVIPGWAQPLSASAPDKLLQWDQ